MGQAGKVGQVVAQVVQAEGWEGRVEWRECPEGRVDS